MANQGVNQDPIICEVLSEIEQKSNILDPRLFDIGAKLNPEIVYHRPQFKPLLQSVLEFLTKGLKEHAIILGSRGAGKTAIVNYLLEQVQIDNANKEKKERQDIEVFYVNCRHVNNSYNVMKELVGEIKRLPAQQIRDKLKKLFSRKKGKKIFLVLDEVDFLKDSDLFYTITRETPFTETYMILITKTPKFYHNLRKDVQSSLNKDFFMFDSYGGPEVYEILKKRADRGLRKYDRKLLGVISNLNSELFNGDIRVGIRVMAKIFKSNDYQNYNIKQIKDFMLDEDLKIKNQIIQGLNSKNLLILYLIIQHKRSNVVYNELCKKLGYAISKSYFFQFIDELKKLDLFIPKKTRSGRSYVYVFDCTNKLYDENIDTVNKLIEQRGEYSE